MEKITLYSTGCPKCVVLKTKLDQAGVDYSVNTNIEEMERLNIENVPVLRIDNELLSFVDAVKWVNNLK